MNTNPLCQLLKIKFPVIQGGMVWCSGWRLAASVAEAGGLGLIGSGSMRPELLREHIRKAFLFTKNSFGVNIPLFYKYSEDFIRIILEEGVRFVVTSAGSPKKYTERLKAEGVVVGHVVPSSALAKKCEDAGVDFVVCEGFEAGGHNGIDEITTFCLIPQVAKSISIPLAAAGGIATGAQILAAQVLGADGVQIGTRFACTKESSAHPAFKETIMNSHESSTVLTLKKLTPVRLAKNAFYQKILDLEARGEDSVENLKELLGTGRARKGIFEGDLEEGELEFGQISALIKDCPTVSEVMEGLIKEYEQARSRFNSD
ncbi:MAG: nitronate monooxygenase [Candidatus Cloacimonetes bacterium]|nr:nitronate monooxygenase [Candidatus Cloacimonadota bacterium]